MIAWSFQLVPIAPTLPSWYVKLASRECIRHANLGLCLALGENGLHGLDGFTSINGIDEAFILKAALDGLADITRGNLFDSLPSKFGFAGIHTELFGRLSGLLEGILHLGNVHRRGTGGRLGQLDAPKLLGQRFDAADLVLLLLEKRGQGLHLLVIVSRSINDGNASRGGAIRNTRMGTRMKTKREKVA